MGAVIGDRSLNPENKPKPNISTAARKIALPINTPDSQLSNLHAHYRYGYIEDYMKGPTES
jgi:hypothetical protein